jgi:hypothetical protein
LPTQGEAELARTRLDEAWQIAERGPMPLYMAELNKAADLISKLGYGRRYDEFTDAESAAQSW